MQCTSCHNDTEFRTDGSDNYWCARCGQSMGRYKHLKPGALKSASDLEALFLALWQAHASQMPQPEAQARPIPDHNHACDFAWPAQRVVVEVDGGQHAPGGGRHNSDGDRWKCNELTALGWRVLHVSGDMLRADPLTFLGQVERALRE